MLYGVTSDEFTMCPWLDWLEFKCPRRFGACDTPLYHNIMQLSSRQKGLNFITSPKISHQSPLDAIKSAPRVSRHCIQGYTWADRQDLAGRSEIGHRRKCSDCDERRQNVVPSRKTVDPRPDKPIDVSRSPPKSKTCPG